MKSIPSGQHDRNRTTYDHNWQYRCRNTFKSMDFESSTRVSAEHSGHCCCKPDNSLYKKDHFLFFTTWETCRSRSVQSEKQAGGNLHIVPPCFRHLCSAVPDSASLVPALLLSAISSSAPSGNSRRNSGRVNSRRHIGRRSHSDVEAPRECRHAHVVHIHSTPFPRGAHPYNFFFFSRGAAFFFSHAVRILSTFF